MCWIGQHAWMCWLGQHVWVCWLGQHGRVCWIGQHAWVCWLGQHAWVCWPTGSSAAHTNHLVVSACLCVACRLLLQITAMRYACTNHTAESLCSMDQGNWCVWQDEGRQGKGQCLLQFGDADFVHFLMWSGTRLPCAGSKVSQIVQCSFQGSNGDCATANCQWTEGACYPKWYAGILTKPKPLALFKRQVGCASSAALQCRTGRMAGAAQGRQRYMCHPSGRACGRQQAPQHIPISSWWPPARMRLPTTLKCTLCTMIASWHTELLCCARRCMWLILTSGVHVWQLICTDSTAAFATTRRRTPARRTLQAASTSQSTTQRYAITGSARRDRTGRHPMLLWLCLEPDLVDLSQQAPCNVWTVGKSGDVILGQQACAAWLCLQVAQNPLNFSKCLPYKTAQAARMPQPRPSKRTTAHSLHDSSMVTHMPLFSSTP